MILQAVEMETLRAAIAGANHEEEGQQAAAAAAAAAGGEGGDDRLRAVVSELATELGDGLAKLEEEMRSLASELVGAAKRDPLASPPFR